MTRILVVDDHEDNVELLRARLEARGYDVECAMDGQEALDKVRAAPPPPVGRRSSAWVYPQRRPRDRRRRAV